MRFERPERKGSYGQSVKADGGKTVLIAAASNGSRHVCVSPFCLCVRAFCTHRCVQILLAHGADATAQDASGYSALHYAAHNGSVEIVQLLLEGGADASAVDGDGCTALHLAQRKGFAEIAALLLAFCPASSSAREDRAKMDLEICCAAKQGDAEQVTRLLAGGWSRKEKVVSNWTKNADRKISWLL